MKWFGSSICESGLVLRTVWKLELEGGIQLRHNHGCEGSVFGFRNCERGCLVN